MARLNLHRSWPSAPWSSLVDELFRAMEPGMGRLGATSPIARGVYPPVNLYETEDGYVLTAELPGFELQDIHVSLEGSTVTVSGERKAHYEGLEGASLHRRERPSGSFRRAFELPGEIDPEHVEAIYRNGVLMLRIPKSAAHKPRRGASAGTEPANPLTASLARSGIGLNHISGAHPNR